MIERSIFMVLLTVMQSVRLCSATHTLQNSSDVTVYPGSITEIDDSTNILGGHLTIHTGATLITAPGTSLSLNNVSLDIGGGHTSMALNSRITLMSDSDAEFDGTVSLGVNSSLTANRNATLSIIGQSMLSIGTNAQAILHDFCATSVDTQSNLTIEDGASFNLLGNASIFARQESLLSIQGQHKSFIINGGAITLVNSKLTISNGNCQSRDSTIQLQNSELDLQANAKLNLMATKLVMQKSIIQLGEQSKIQQFIGKTSLNVNKALITLGDNATFSNSGSVNANGDITIDDNAELSINFGAGLLVQGSIYVQQGASLYVLYNCTVIGAITVRDQNVDLCNFPKSVAPCTGCPVPQPTVPVTQPTIPVTQPTIPVTQPTIPVTQPTIPTNPTPVTGTIPINHYSTAPQHGSNTKASSNVVAILGLLLGGIMWSLGRS